MHRPRIIVSVEGGQVGDVLTNVEEAEVIVVDWDAGPENAGAAGAVRILRDGKLHVALVGGLPAEPLPSGDYPLIREALETAGYGPAVAGLCCLSRQELTAVLAMVQQWQAQVARPEQAADKPRLGQPKLLSAAELNSLIARLSSLASR